jgi:hypothetical protein
LIKSPTIPTYNNKSISSISSGFNKRLIASITIPKQSENKNTELISGPSTSALTHPNVFLVDARFEI